MTFFIQLMVSGLLVGGIYALVALGIVLIFKCTGVFNFAQGNILLLSAYLCWTLTQFLPLWLSFVLTLALAILMGFVIERIALRPMIGQPIFTAIMVTIALSFLMDGIAVTVWGGRVHNYPEFISVDPWRLGEIAISQQNAYSFIIAMLLVTAFIFFFKYSKQGLAMRAVAEDHQGAQSSGIAVKGVSSMVWIIACVAGAVAGVLLGSINGIQPLLSAIGLKAIPVVLLGGLDSIPGCIIAGLIVGALENIAAGYIDPLIGGGFKEVFPYIILMVVLVTRPYGLFGLKRIERV